MATITAIKQAILRMDAGSFQILCDSYLSKEGYPDIVSLGTEAGSNKTTLGTPDTYFCLPNGKYVFVEYTTQCSCLASKIRTDIDKCLDVDITGIDTNNIEEIIYCHTSSNIKPKDDNELKVLCAEHGIKLTILGIDTLAADLYLKYQTLVKDHLGIAVDTGQILSCDDFVKQYDANTLAAPLDIPFFFRKREIESIDAAFESTDVVILSGPAGTGKTRLAIQYARKHAEENNETLYCIQDRAISIYDDLMMHLEKPGKYFVVIDDANQLSNLEWIVEYVNKRNLGFEVKILITVRDYAIEKVKYSIRNIAANEVLTINRFTNDEIRSIVSTTFDILNIHYLDRIVLIADGNARMAVLAAKTACSTNCIDSIYDASQLYSEYYGRALVDTGLIIDKDLLIVAGIIAFLSAIHLDHICVLEPFIERSNLTKDTFIEAAFKLNDLEIIDIYHDKAIRFSDQCFANFMLKYVFYDKKLLSLSAMIELCFKPFKNRVYQSVNTLVNVFYDEKLHQFIESEIDMLWKKLDNNNSPYFREYVQAFACFNPTETLSILRDEIKEVVPVSITANEIDIQNGKNNATISDDIINILGSFSDPSDLECALDLFFQYYLKRPDIYMQFYHASILFFGIQKDSRIYNYHTTTVYIQKIIEYSEDWNNEFILTLFLDVAKKFLNLHFTSVERSVRNNDAKFYSFYITDNKGAIEYRNLIWSQLLLICQNKGLLSEIRELLSEYGQYSDNVCHAVIASDANYITSIVQTYFSNTNLADNIIAEHLQHVFTMSNLQYNVIDDFLNNKKMKLYKLLEGYMQGYDLGYDEQLDEKQRKINEYMDDSLNKIESFGELLNICKEVTTIENADLYAINQGINFALDKIDNLELISIVNTAITDNTIAHLPEKVIIDRLFSILSADDIYQLLLLIKNESAYDFWAYAYFDRIPENLVDEKSYERLIIFLTEKADSKVTSAHFRDIGFLKKYKKINPEALINGVKLIFSKRRYSEYASHLYLSLLFNKCQYSPKDVVCMFEGDLKLLEDIYMWCISFSNMTDYDGTFLMEICKQDPDFRTKYINTICQRVERYDCKEEFSKLRIFYESADYIDVMDEIMEKSILYSSYPRHMVSQKINQLITERQGEETCFEKAHKWVQHYICQNALQQEKMECIFEAFANCSHEQRLIYINLFLQYNEHFEAFKSLPLIPQMRIWSGSAVPMYSADQDFYNAILPFLTGLKYIEHKKYIQQRINTCRRAIISEQISDIMEG